MNSNSTPPLKIATVQCKAMQDNLDGAINDVLKVLTKTNREKIDIVCFPECYLTGYYHTKESVREHALSLSSIEFKNFLLRIKDFRPTVIIGLIELKDDKVYNTAVIIEQGRVVGEYNKVHLNEEKYTAGKSSPVFKKNGVTYGINICSDANFPETAQKLKANGAQIIFYPLNNLLPHAIADEWRGKGEQILSNRAKETSCWIVASDVVFDDSKLENYQKSYGGTLIVNPTGEIIKKVNEFEEGLISI